MLSSYAFGNDAVESKGGGEGKGKGKGVVVVKEWGCRGCGEDAPVLLKSSRSISGSFTLWGLLMLSVLLISTGGVLVVGRHARSNLLRICFGLAIVWGQKASDCQLFHSKSRRYDNKSNLIRYHQLLMQRFCVDVMILHDFEEYVVYT